MSMNESNAVRHFQQGFSLIELLIALALGLAVLVGFTSVFVAVKQSFRFQETTGRMQEDATFALDSMAKDLRMAGYAGCAGINQTVASGTTTYSPGSVLNSSALDGINGINPLAIIEPTDSKVTAQPFTENNFIRGFDGVPNGMFEADKVPLPSIATHSLFFAGASSKAVSFLMTSTNAPLAIVADTYKWSTGATPLVYNFIVSDCKSSSLFKGNVTAVGGLSIKHTSDLGNSQNTFKSDTIFGTDAIVMPAEWRFYYVATRAGASTPSLYRVFFDGHKRGEPEELVSNVERLQLNYGQSAPSPSTDTAVADWRTCAGPATATCDKPVIDWSRVVAVRIGLMMISSEDNANPGVKLTVPTLLGQAYNLPAGASENRLRKEFSTTVVLRNRVAAR